MSCPEFIRYFELISNLAMAAECVLNVRVIAGGYRFNPLRMTDNVFMLLTPQLVTRELRGGINAGWAVRMHGHFPADKFQSLLEGPDLGLSESEPCLLSEISVLLPCIDLE